MATSGGSRPTPTTGLVRAYAVPFVLLLLLVVPLASMAYLRIQEARRTRVRAEMAEFRKALAIGYSMPRPLPRELVGARPTMLLGAAFPPIQTGPDPWGNPYLFTIEGSRACTITCLGADGLPGGSGFDEDLEVRWPGP